MDVAKAELSSLCSGESLSLERFSISSYMNVCVQTEREGGGREGGRERERERKKEREREKLKMDHAYESLKNQSYY